MNNSAGMLVLLAAFFLGAASANAGMIGLPSNSNPAPSSGGTAPRTIPQTVNPPFVYDPHEDIYDWKIKDHPDDPCYYDNGSGQWLGDCNLYQTAPGYSITVPNRINR